MRYLRSLISAVSMFTAIPMPQLDWDMEHGSRMTACLGLVGALLGALELLLVRLLDLLSLPVPVFAVLTVGLGCLLTGFLHLDGFMDVCDALLSHRDEAGRRRILKDPHCGSFAVISLCLLLAAALAAVYSLRAAGSALSPAVIVAMPVLSRTAAGLLLLSAKTMPESSLGAYFKTGNGPGVKVLLILSGAAALAAVWIAAGPLCTGALLAAVILSAALGLYAAHRLGGVNGDVAGFAVVLCETLMLLALTPAALI